jgi:uncharacterized membrane protein (DUF485 family)
VLLLPLWVSALLFPVVILLVVPVGIAVIWLSFVVHQVLSWRRATGERRG